MFKQFDYYAPDNTLDVFNLLSKTNSKILAGGTDLFVKMREGKVSPSIIVDIKKINGLNEIREEGKFIVIGSLITINKLMNNKLIKKMYQSIIDASVLMGCNEIRNKATIGGNLCNASPGAEFGSVFLVLDAVCGILSKNGLREVSLEKFYKGPGRTCMKNSEILIYIKIPKFSKNDRSIYLRYSRVKGMDLAGMNIAVAVSNYKTPSKRVFKIALGAMAPTPVRNKKVEKILSKKIITQDMINKSKSILQNSYSPRATSLRATPEFKKIIAGNYLEIALEKLNVK